MKEIVVYGSALSGAIHNSCQSVFIRTSIFVTLHPISDYKIQKDFRKWVTLQKWNTIPLTSPWVKLCLRLWWNWTWYILILLQFHHRRFFHTSLFLDLKIANEKECRCLSPSVTSLLHILLHSHFFHSRYCLSRSCFFSKIILVFLSHSLKDRY